MTISKSVATQFSLTISESTGVVCADESMRHLWTLFILQLISQVLEVQFNLFLFCWKAETNAQNFHEEYLFRKEN